MTLLRQIAPAAMPPAPTDTIVGVVGGSTDVQYTANQIAQIVPTPATANLTFYVNGSTGNDSNPGTSAGSAFKTIQRAVNVAGRFDYVNMFFPTINVADGTYVQTSQIGLPQLINIGNNNGVLVGDNATPTNCLVKSFGFSLEGSTSIWSIGGFQIDVSAAAHITVQSGATLLIANSLTFSDSGASNSTVPFFLNAYGAVTWQGQGSLTLTAAQYFNFIQAFNFSAVDLEFGTINFPNPCAFAGGLGSGFAQISGNSSLIYTGMAYTNFATVTGNRVRFLRQANVATANGEFIDFPGNANGTADSTVEWRNIGAGQANEFANKNAGIPSTTQLDAGMYGIYKDTSGGGVYLAYNDAGTIKKVALT